MADDDDEQQRISARKREPSDPGRESPLGAPGDESVSRSQAEAAGEVSAMDVLGEQDRLNRRRQRNATHSRRKREEVQVQISALRQDCERLSAANMNLFHHNKVS
jgi:hypothetical protein